MSKSDSIQQCLADYASDLTYDALSPEAIHAAKVRIIDTLGALLGGFFGEPCQIARNFASRMPQSKGASIIGTRIKTSPELAAFVNSTTARYAELLDSYHWPGSSSGHPSDVITPILAAAEHSQVGGCDFLTGVILGYEVYLRMSDVFHNVDSFDHTILGTLGTAVAAGKLFGLSPAQLSHCIAMAIVPNVTLRLVRFGHASMFKTVASGQSGWAGVSSALYAKAGLEGPYQPFEGQEGWCKHIAKEHFSLNALGGRGDNFKIVNTQIKIRASAGTIISAILAAEKIAHRRNINELEHIKVEIYKKAKINNATGDHNWHPNSRETADHSVPYCVGVTLMDGTVTLKSFNDRHLWDPQLRALIQKIEVVENDEFTKAYERLPQKHRTRVTAVTCDGEQLVGESGGDSDDLAAPKSDEQIEHKFRELTDGVLGTQRVDLVLKLLWNLEDLRDIAEIPSALIFD